MKLTAEVQANLGNAVLLSCDRVAIMVSRAWTIFIQEPEQYIDKEFLDHAAYLESSDTQDSLDYRVLCAKEFQDDHFLPAMGKKMEPIAGRLGLGDVGGPATPTYKGMENLIIENQAALEWDVSITEMLNSGKSEPVFANKEGEGVVSKLTSGRDKAEYYRFRVKDKLIAINGDILRGLTSLGMEVVFNSSLLAPVLGLVHEDQNIFGLLMPLNKTGVDRDDMGRDLYYDVHDLCWTSRTKAEEMLQGDLSFYDPCSNSVDWDDLNLDDRISQRKWTKAARAIATLRWHGVPDAEIVSLAQKFQYDAWCSIYQKALEAASSMLEEVESFSQRTETVDTYSVNAVRRFVTKTSAICERVETLTGVMGKVGGDGGDGLGLGHLPKLVQYVKELEEVCGLS